MKNLILALSCAIFIMVGCSEIVEPTTTVIHKEYTLEDIIYTTKIIPRGEYRKFGKLEIGYQGIFGNSTWGEYPVITYNKEHGSRLQICSRDTVWISYSKWEIPIVVKKDTTGINAVSVKIIKTFRNQSSGD